VVLIYNLIVVKGRGKPSASRTDQSPKMLRILKKIKCSDKPVAYILENQYTLRQWHLGLKGRDRCIVSSLVAAVSEVGGLAAYLVDVESSLETYEDADDMEYNSDETDAYDFKRVDNSSHKFENAFHIAGEETSLFYINTSWEHKLLAFGSKFTDRDPYDSLENYTGNEGTQIENSKL